MNKSISAFPNPYSQEDIPPECGMTLHDWYVGCALTGLLAGGRSLPDSVRAAKAVADAVLTAREVDQ